ncbi:PASTA domain-containing protein [Streptomyces sp. MJP52]|uniref:PASTA domain-containing protein n=1 Tax=Streptomyces sp. MJP52 TaxID=2940555 RepID=UPI0024747CF0|nr:PASTA domain-containing protein [Streptomyces sp. MJP52]MDH6228165.1 beta-lactam-binding protein with PASTA domain [Streptomyces sp. MJP52]
MRIVRSVTAASLLLAALAACGPADDGGADAKPTVSPVESATDAAPETSTSAAPVKAELPDMVGKGLQSAQDEAQALGFYFLTSHDSLGRGRMQTLDRNWKVCSQTPKPGTHMTDVEVDFGTVKLEEQCPEGGDQAEPEKADGTMPNFVGKSVKVARDALDSSTSITVEDASGQGRMVFLESNWEVCSTDPAAGAKLDGQPVTIEAVKFGESC